MHARFTHQRRLLDGRESSSRRPTHRGQRPRVSDRKRRRKERRAPKSSPTGPVQEPRPEPSDQIEVAGLNDAGRPRRKLGEELTRVPSSFWKHDDDGFLCVFFSPPSLSKIKKTRLAGRTPFYSSSPSTALVIDPQKFIHCLKTNALSVCPSI